MSIMKGRQKGFTLIELLIVVAILGILAAVIIPNVGRFLGSGETEAQDTEFQNLITAVGAMMVDEGISTLPNPVTGAVGGDTECVGNGTRIMSQFPDIASAVTVGKLNAPETGTAYAAGDGDGFVLFGHDRIADAATTTLTNYMTVSKSKFCYESTGDGTITQYKQAGAQTNP